MNVNQISPELLRNEAEIVQSWNEGYENPLVSISCITYNQELYLEDAIVGFLKQETSFPFEILIHDDASTDGTVAIIKKYEELYPRIIKPLCQSENQYSKGKVPSFFNTRRAKGEYIAICEGDDYWLSTSHLHDAIQAFKKNGEITIYGSVCIVDKGVSKQCTTTNKNQYSLRSYIEDAPFVATCSLVTKASVWSELHEIPVLGGRYFAGDTRLKLIGLTKGEMFVGEDPSVLYRKGRVGSWSKRVVTERIILQELLDNLAITREVGCLSDFSEHDALYKRLEREVLLKGAHLASKKGIHHWLVFIILHLKVISPKYIRSTMSTSPIHKLLRIVKPFGHHE